MEQDETTLPKIIPCPLTMHEVCILLDTHVKRLDDQGLRIEIRGAFRDIWTRKRVLLLEWYFLKSWAERSKIMGLFSLPFDEEHRPWPEVRYLLYEGPGELRFRLITGHYIESHERDEVCG